MNPTTQTLPDRRSHRARVRSNQPQTLRLDAPESPGRAELERCIAGRFHDQHDARIEEFLPHLISIGTGQELSGVVGLRPAGNTGLFLEQYLDMPVEQAISRAFLTPVDRADIVEIGNLAAGVRGETYALFAMLARVLYLSGYRWIVCTATLQVEAMLDKVRFPTQAICAADPGRLGDRARDWGNYYSSRPRVLTGEVHVANDLLQATPPLLELTRQVRTQIEEIAATLTRAPR